MNKYFIAAVLAVCLFSCGAAEAKKSLAADRPINWSKELNLSKEQKVQLKEIYDQSHEKIKSLMQQIDTLHREIANIHKEDDAKVRMLLNEKQQIKFDKIQARKNKGNPDFEKAADGKKPSRKRMRNYGGI